MTRRTTLCALLAGALALGSTHTAAAAGRHSPGAGEGGEPGSATTAQATGTAAARAIEDELVIQTPMSAFVVDAMLKEFVQYAKERWAVTLRTRVLRAGTPVSFEAIVNWGGQPEADVFWGGDPALFGELGERKLLDRLDLPAALWDAVPASIGSPRPIPLKGQSRLWVGTGLEVYGIAYSPRLLKQLGVADLRDWDDLLQPKLKGQIVQCMPTRSSSSHATYQVILQIKGEASGWEWLRRLGGQTGRFVTSSREVPSLVARTELAVGFGVPSYYAFEEKLADLFYSPERYISMFGYERSVSFPSGHRNVVHAERGFGRADQRRVHLNQLPSSMEPEAALSSRTAPYPRTSRRS